VKHYQCIRYIPSGLWDTEPVRAHLLQLCNSPAWSVETLATTIPVHRFDDELVSVSLAVLPTSTRGQTLFTRLAKASRPFRLCGGVPDADKAPLCHYVDAVIDYDVYLLPELGYPVIDDFYTKRVRTRCIQAVCAIPFTDALLSRVARLLNILLRFDSSVLETMPSDYRTLLSTLEEVNVAHSLSHLPTLQIDTARGKRVLESE